VLSAPHIRRPTPPKLKERPRERRREQHVNHHGRRTLRREQTQSQRPYRDAQGRKLYQEITREDRP
jgi:hypothetical protein